MFYHLNPQYGQSVPSGVNHQLESRMREIRTYGSEGGAAGKLAVPTPIRDWGSEASPIDIMPATSHTTPRDTLRSQAIVSPGCQNFPSSSWRSHSPRMIVIAVQCSGSFFPFFRFFIASQFAQAFSNAAQGYREALAVHPTVHVTFL